MTGYHPYLAKPHSGMNPNRGVATFTMDWMARMAEDKTRVEVHLSTDSSDQPWDSWEFRGEPADVFRRVLTHMLFRRRHGTLQPGRYCVRVPGHVVHKHSFEVE